MASYAKYGGGGGGSVISLLRTFLGGIATDLILSATATAIALRSSVADGAAAVGHVLDTANALVTAGSKIASLRNGGVEQLFVGFDGSVVPATGTPSLGASGAAWAALWVSDINLGDALLDDTGAQRMTIDSASPSISLGGPADGATAIAHKLKSLSTYAAVGARLVSIQNNSTEKFAVHKDGKTIQPYSSSAGSPGAATNNNPTGRAAIASGASSVVVTNSTVTAASIVKVQLETSAVGVSNLSVVPAAGSFTVTALNGTGVATSVTGNATFSFIVSNL